VGAIRQVQEEAAPESPAEERGLPAIRLAAILGIPVTAVLLGVLAATSGLGVAGWITGLAVGVAATTLLVTARSRSDNPAFLPADWITLTRALLSAGVAGLVADSFVRPVSITALVTLSILALILDGVDGQVARRTNTATPLGARLDGEVDAFLILLLSVAVSRDYGDWVLAIGAARYVFLLAGWLIPWLAAPLPPRFWRKVVAAVEGIVLTVAVSGVLDKIVGIIAVAAALLLLIESFGRDVIWLYRAGAGTRTRTTVRLAVLAGSVLLVWADLVVPDRIWQFTPAAFARIPVEGLVLVAVALVLPPVARRIVAGVAGILFGVLTIAKILNLAFYEFVDRAFNPIRDWVSIGPGVGVVRDSIGYQRTWFVLAALVLGILLLVAAITAATIHLTTVAARHRRGTVRGLVAVAAVWALSAGLSLQFAPGFRVASTSDAGLAVAEVRAAHSAITDKRHFAQVIKSSDPEAGIPASDLLAGLRGKDVIIAVVESYGQVAVRDSSIAPGVDAVLRRSDAALTKAGWSTQSAWLTSPTFGGISWLAHSTLQSGLWINSSERYNQLVGSKRFTLSDAFDKAGWHTVADDPSDNRVWRPGKKFYHYAQLYNRFNVGYQGPNFAYAKVPDQYTLAKFQQNELGPGHKPVMAEIDLVSSHSPWTPLPSMVPWSKLGNGAIFNPQPGPQKTAIDIAGNATEIRTAYGDSIQYTMTALTSWVTELNDPNLVLILYGDHQPFGPVTSPGASHAVPISIIARDPSVFRQISSWHWQDGLLPGHTAPLEPMSAFRNRFLDAFSTPAAQTAASP
jgi:phosphatidylglycerophosphate synthase